MIDRIVSSLTWLLGAKNDSVKCFMVSRKAALETGEAVSSGFSELGLALQALFAGVYRLSEADFKIKLLKLSRTRIKSVHNHRYLGVEVENLLNAVRLLIWESSVDAIKKQRSPYLAVLAQLQLNLSLDCTISRWLHIDLHHEVLLFVAELAPLRIVDQGRLTSLAAHFHLFPAQVRDLRLGNCLLKLI